jgi:hypothetical protein
MSPNRRTSRAKAQTTPTARPSDNDQGEARKRSNYLVLAAEVASGDRWHELGRQLDTNAAGAKKATAEEILKRKEDDPIRQALVEGKLVLATVPLQSWQPTRVRYERPEPTLRFDD